MVGARRRSFAARGLWGRMKRSIGLLIASQLAAGAATADQADPYPFDGYFALKESGADHLACGFDILHQTRGGDFSGYLFDRRDTAEVYSRAELQAMARARDARVEAEVLEAIRSREPAID